MATRQEVYEAIDTERAYQDSRWASEGKHSLEEWFTYIQDYVREAQHALTRKPLQDAQDEALAIMRKVAGMAVCTMEEHGAPKRTFV